VNLFYWNAEAVKASAFFMLTEAVAFCQFIDL